MTDSRRSFLRSAAVAGLTAAAAAQDPQPAPAADVQVPKMKFGNAEISRLICGCNPFYGFGHFNQTLGVVMRDYYSADRVCDVLHQCTRFGINAFNYYPGGRGRADLERFLAEGGKIHLIAQGMGDQSEFVKTFKPLAVYHHGEYTDTAFQTGKMGDVRDWCRKVRDLGTLVGVGTHKPEVIAMIEEQNWDV
ncbi:MAG TPA: twin-arginine translocation signal domain-containing protein, partial [Candidatus Sulfopaludibacter sp.]|nr:twin-arginine translocation signal domain-containing protein [Candidatus Sulfopaludibacter sp.]